MSSSMMQVGNAFFHAAAQLAVGLVAGSVLEVAMNSLLPAAVGGALVLDTWEDIALIGAECVIQLALNAVVVGGVLANLPVNHAVAGDPGSGVALSLSLVMSQRALVAKGTALADALQRKLHAVLVGEDKVATEAAAGSPAGRKSLPKGNPTGKLNITK